VKYTRSAVICAKRLSRSRCRLNLELGGTKDAHAILDGVQIPMRRHNFYGNGHARIILELSCRLSNFDSS